MVDINEITCSSYFLSAFLLSVSRDGARFLEGTGRVVAGHEGLERWEGVNNYFLAVVVYYIFCNYCPSPLPRKFLLLKWCILARSERLY